MKHGEEPDSRDREGHRQGETSAGERANSSLVILRELPGELDTQRFGSAFIETCVLIERARTLPRQESCSRCKFRDAFRSGGAEGVEFAVEIPVQWV